MRSVVGKLYQILTGGDASVPPRKENFITWCQPGIPYEPAQLEFLVKGIAGATGDETRDLVAQAADFARLVNFVPDPSGIYDAKQQDPSYVQRGTLIWNVYDAVLRKSQVAHGELTPDQKAKLEKFRNLLHRTVKVKHVNLVTDAVTEEESIEDGPILKLYREKQTAYDDAVTNYNAKRIAAMNSESPQVVQDFTLNGDVYRRRVKTAENDWISAGYKNDVEAMIAYIQGVTQRDLTLWKSMLQSQLKLGEMSGISGSPFPFHYTTLVPAAFAKSAGWTTFTMKEENLSTYERSETNAWNANASYGPFFSVQTNGQITRTQGSEDMSRFNLSFELAVVQISRPWFSPEFLANTSWRWAPEVGEADLSNGLQPPDGQLVAYPTAAVFIRNLKLDCADLRTNRSSYEQQISVGTRLNFGFFSLGGSYRRGVSEHQFSSKFTENGLEVPGMQIIGFRCAVLPKSPNPSPTVQTWA